jgi:hypothetical protein
MSDETKAESKVTDEREKTETRKDYRREDVAKWARYCVGSCYGDWSPEAEAIYDEVMRNDETFEFYRKTLEEDAKWRRGTEKALEAQRNAPARSSPPGSRPWRN